jgi:hypothetical protein
MLKNMRILFLIGLKGFKDACLIHVLSRPGDDAGGHSAVCQYTRA